MPGHQEEHLGEDTWFLHHVLFLTRCFNQFVDDRITSGKSPPLPRTPILQVPVIILRVLQMFLWFLTTGVWMVMT